MSVAHGASTFIPYVCAVYTCKCGRRAVQHSTKSGAPPPGWETRGTEVHVCNVCCGKAPRSAT